MTTDQDNLYLPDPECRHGYTLEQIDEIFNYDMDLLNDFDQWIDGQTMVLCDGQRYNHDTRKYEICCEFGHGPVVFTWDVQRYLMSLPIID